MIETFLEWRANTRGELTEVGVEVDVDGALDATRWCGVRLRGRVDRIERDAAGRLVIVDVKTGKTPVSKDDAQRHAQLAAYQLAVAEGLVAHGDEPGGGRLVYLGRTGSAGATEREQDPLTPEARAQWRDRIQRGGRRRRPGRSSSPGSTTAARTARCGRAARPTPVSTEGIGMTATAVTSERYSPAELATALGLFEPTAEQAAVIAAPPGPLVVIAGAGAGKTETMAARVVWLVANGYAEPGQVLGLTFTRKAAGQLLRRVRSRLARLSGTGLDVGSQSRRARRSAGGQHVSRVRRATAARIRPAVAG